MKKTTIREATPARERRMISFAEADLRVEQRSGKSVLIGLTAPFNKDSLDLGGFIERIQPGAFTEALKSSDPVGLFNHNPDNLLGRASASTLRLEQRDDGLHYELDMPDTEIGKRVVVAVERGDLRGNSFAFTVEEANWEELDQDTWLRTITKVAELWDVGPVVNPAYPDTSVALRSLEHAKQILVPGSNLERYVRRQRQAELDVETGIR